MAKIDVQKIVDRLRDECFSAHRGVFWWEESLRIAVAFGNDGYGKDERSRRSVEALRELLQGSGGEELGFATAGEEDYHWAIACTLPVELQPQDLEAALWRAWSGTPKTAEDKAIAAGFASIQTREAQCVLERHALL